MHGACWAYAGMCHTAEWWLRHELLDVMNDERSAYGCSNRTVKVPGMKATSPPPPPAASGAELRDEDTSLALAPKLRRGTTPERQSALAQVRMDKLLHDVSERHKQRHAACPCALLQIACPCAHAALKQRPQWHAHARAGAAGPAPRLAEGSTDAYENASPDSPCAAGGILGTHGVPACCPSTCGECGGKGCAQRPGGRNACCALHIKRRCSSSVPPPCLLPPRWQLRASPQWSAARTAVPATVGVQGNAAPAAALTAGRPSSAAASSAASSSASSAEQATLRCTSFYEAIMGRHPGGEEGVDRMLASSNSTTRWSPPPLDRLEGSSTLRLAILLHGDACSQATLPRRLSQAGARASLRSRREAVDVRQLKCARSLVRHVVRPYEAAGHIVRVFATANGAVDPMLVYALRTAISAVSVLHHAGPVMYQLAIALRDYMAWTAAHDFEFDAVLLTRCDVYFKARAAAP